MPMTEELQRALIDSNTSMDHLVELLNHDGINSRESETYDTPLILAIRHNNIHAVELILNMIGESEDRGNILHAVNHLNETPLIAALKIETDKRIALLLINHGAELESGISEDIPDASKLFLNTFIEFQKLNGVENLSASDLEKRGQCKYEIGAMFDHELQDTATSYQWYESAAYDGNKQSMQILAAHCLEAGELNNAIEWYKRCFSAAKNTNERNAVIAQLKSIASTQDQNHDAAYTIAMAIAFALAGSGDIEEAITCFANSEEYYHSQPNQNENDTLFFKACSLWNGPSVEHEIGMLDCLDYTTRIVLLLHANTENAQYLLKSIIASNKSKILQLITCQLCKDAGMLTEADLEPLTNAANQPYIDALSYLYGWNGKPKNTLRGASLFKKIIESSKNLDTNTLFMAYSLIAFAYLQQEAEQDIYVPEAFAALNNAHASLGKQDSPHRKEIINTILDGFSYV